MARPTVTAAGTEIKPRPVGRGAGGPGAAAANREGSGDQPLGPFQATAPCRLLKLKISGTLRALIGRSPSNAGR